uniref:Helicase C-terminal domain-containing protein n=1 Tax=Parascaris univalens TaxID=6257 RepID=A0A915AWY0_PARUN
MFKLDGLCSFLLFQILSTNIAEASLTIDDVVFVVDCGKVKEKTYDHSTRINELKMAWIAKSNAEQRAGRAGRCRAGYCFRLYSVDDYDRMNSTQVAEMKRAAIHDVCLHAKMFAPENMSVKKFLSLAPEPPSPQAVEWSLEFLEQLGALYGDRNATASYEGRFSVCGRERREPDLTELGRHIAQLPLEPQLARLLLFGIALRCFNPVVTLVAALSHRDPFILPLGDERAAALAARDEFGRCDYSDHLMLLRAFNAFSRLAHGQRQWHFCKTKFLSPNTMKMIAGIRRQLLIELRRLRLLPASCHSFDDPDLNRYSCNWPMVQAAIVAGCYPGIGFVRAGNKLRKIRTSTESSATLHPGCIIKRQVLAPSRRSDMINQFTTKREDEEPIIEYLAFQELSKIDEGLTLRTVTVVSPLSVVLFAGAICLKKETIEQFGVGDEISFDEASLDQNDEEDGAPSEGEYVLEMESWLVFKGRYRDMQAVLKLRFKVMSYFLEVMKNPGRTETDEDRLLLLTLEHVLSEDHRRSRFYECSDLQGPRFRQSGSLRSEEWMLDLVCTQRQQGADEEHMQKVRREHSSKHASHLAEGFWLSSHEIGLHVPENGYSDMRSCSGTTGGNFRQCPTVSNFRLSFENRANNAHRSRHAQSFAISGASYWKDCHATNIRNRASDRRTPFCTYDSHKRWDIRSAVRRNAETGIDGEESKQGAAWDDYCTNFRIRSKTCGDRQGERFEQLTEEGQLDEEQVPEDPCSTKNKEADAENPSCEDSGALWRREEESEESPQLPSGRGNAMRVPAGRYKTPKRSNGEGWYGGPKEFTKCSLNLSHSASEEGLLLKATKHEAVRTRRSMTLIVKLQEGSIFFPRCDEGKRNSFFENRTCGAGGGKSAVQW